MSIIIYLIQLYTYALLARVILSWFPIRYGSPLQSVMRVLIEITEPILGPVRRMLPPMGGLDLSPIVVFIGLEILVYVLSR